jgi:pimeloyl-ACP methyl ester carboxylesterase
MTGKRVRSDHDLLTDATARETASALAGSRVIRIPNCGHSQFADQPVAFLEAVTTFLTGQGL